MEFTAKNSGKKIKIIPASFQKAINLKKEAFKCLNKTNALEKIKDLNSKFPEKHILEICKLKYNQNLSVKEISEHINLEISCIIEALNEIIDAIKD